MGNVACCDGKDTKSVEVDADTVKCRIARGEEEQEEERDELSDEGDGEVEHDSPPPPVQRGPRGACSAEAWRRGSVSAGAGPSVKDFKPPVYVKTPDQKERIQHALTNSFLFANLEGEAFDQVIDAFKEELFAAGTTVIEQFDTNADRLFVIEKGRLDVFQKKKVPDEPGHGAKVFTFEDKGSFGDIALLYSCPRTATIVAETDSTLWSLDRETFNHLVKGSAQKKRERREAFLSKVPILLTLTDEERAKIAETGRSVSFKTGDMIIREGDVGQEFFLVEEGEASALKGGEVVRAYQVTDYFGELALIKDQPRAATVRADKRCSCIVLDRATFKRLLGPLDALLEARAAEYSGAAAA